MITLVVYQTDVPLGLKGVAVKEAAKAAAG
jgi:hypothetical protein